MEPETRHKNHYVQIFRRKTLYLITASLVIYLGLEVTVMRYYPGPSLLSWMSFNVGPHPSDIISGYGIEAISGTSVPSSDSDLVELPFFAGRSHGHCINNNG